MIYFSKAKDYRTFLANINDIFILLSPTSSHFHPLQVVNCDRNTRPVVDKDDNGKLGLERLKALR